MTRSLTTRDSSDQDGHPAHAPVEARPARPVVGWAVVGAAFLVLEAYVIGRWLLAGPVPVGPGPREMSSVKAFGLIALQVASVLAALAALYVWVVRPLRTRRKMTPEGMLLLAFTLSSWQDPLANYAGLTFTYNANWINLGSWGRYTPGWLSPQTETPEPLFMIFPAYLWCLFGATILSVRIARRVKARWPSLGAARMIALFWAFFFVMDCVWETTFIFLFEGWSYGGMPGPYLFRGEYFQFPLAEALVFGATWATWASIWYFRNDRGETIVERGTGKLHLSPKRMQWTRFLALNGMVNMVFIVVLYVPYTYLALHQKTWPDSITSRSYLVGDTCGQDNPYACPRTGDPIPRPGSGYIGTDGRYVPVGG